MQIKIIIQLLPFIERQIFKYIKYIKTNIFKNIMSM